MSNVTGSSLLSSSSSSSLSLSLPPTTRFTNFYQWLMSKSDPRINDWPLMSSPFPILMIISLYVYLVKSLGPRLMKNRSKPFQIESLIIVYNIIMVITSATLFHLGGQLTYIPPGGKFSLLCEPIDYGINDDTIRLLAIGWWLLIVKLIEFLDTIFFLLRKKFSHISMLHVLHHSMVPWGLWIGLKFGAGGHNAFFPLINAFIHTIMYSYYCLSAFGPRIQKYLWWKRYLTILQMLQFAIALIHSSIPLIIDCGFPPFFTYALLFHAIFFWILFYRFYRKRYFSTSPTIANNNQNQNRKRILPEEHETLNENHKKQHLD